jgi:Arm DNA-binding domain
MALSQLAIINAKPKDKPYLLLDGDGLHLQICTSGSRLWRLRFRGKANMLSLGAFPAVSLKEAREKRDQIKKQIAAGIDPSLRRKLDKISAASADTFGGIADEYLANQGQRCRGYHNQKEPLAARRACGPDPQSAGGRNSPGRVAGYSEEGRSKRPTRHGPPPQVSYGGSLPSRGRNGSGLPMILPTRSGERS